jgi:hypothetical protein
MTIFIASDQEESLFLSWLIAFASFILLLVRISSASTHSFNHFLSVCGEYGFEISLHRLVDRWFCSNRSNMLRRLYAWLAACLHTWYRTKKRSGRVLFLLLRISNLAKDTFLLPLRSLRERVSSICLFRSWSPILPQCLKSACIVYVLSLN